MQSFKTYIRLIQPAAILNRKRGCEGKPEITTTKHGCVDYEPVISSSSYAQYCGVMGGRRIKNSQVYPPEGLQQLDRGLYP